MQKVVIVIGILIAVIAALVVIGWVGLQIKPRPFPAYPAEAVPEDNTEPLPQNLPPPVARFYRTTIGDHIPVIESAVVTGRADVRFMGITLPARFRFIYDAGQAYRHYIEATFFGIPLLKINEYYLNGNARLELPFGVTENEPRVDMAANLGLWGESVFLPSIYLTDPRVRWEAINETTARLVVPFGEEEDSFTVTFDPQSGRLLRMEAMRWKEADSEVKTRWILEPQGWTRFHGMELPSPAAGTWEDEGTPWLILTVEDVAYNVDVSEYIRARGL